MASSDWTKVLEALGIPTKKIVAIDAYLAYTWLIRELRQDTIERFKGQRHIPLGATETVIYELGEDRRKDLRDRLKVEMGWSK